MDCFVCAEIQFWEDEHPRAGQGDSSRNNHDDNNDNNNINDIKCP